MEKHTSTCYTGRFEGLPVAPEETERFDQIVAEVAEHDAEGRLRSVTVGAGTVIGPAALTAALLTVRGEVSIERVLPSQPCSRCFSVGDDVVVFLFTAWNGGQYEEQCHLFRQQR